MGKVVGRLTIFVSSLILSLSVQLLPHFHQSATAGAENGKAYDTSVQDQSDPQAIARVTIKSQQDLEHLAASGITLARKGDDLFIMTTLARSEQLRNEGWAIQVLYFQTSNGWEVAEGAFPEGGCTHSISPTNRAFTSSGGFGLFDIITPSQCEWQVLSSAPWVTINGVGQGSGNATISFSVAANNSSDRRVGSIFVVDQIFTVFQGAQFNDVPTNHPFYLEISKISARGITVGCGGGNFCPNQPVTREQMAALIIRVLGVFNPPTPMDQRFADVPPSNPFYAFIEEMAVRMITSGCGGGNYCPSANVTREQMAAFIIRALGEPNPPTPPTQRFQDVPPSNQFYAFIDRLAARGITQGCSASPPLFCPTQAVTRAEMAAFLVRAFNL